MAEETLYFNGVNAETGAYAMAPRSLKELAALAMAPGASPSPTEARGLSDWRAMRDKGLRQGNAKDLAQAGWGVIFAQADERAEALKDALRELLDHRRAQAGKVYEHYYQEYFGEKGYRAGDSKGTFLGRFGVGPGPADPDLMPYYLLIVGDPEIIPFEFQYQLDVQYAVGRLSFDTVEEYARYAHAVVQAETAPPRSKPRRVALFGAQHPGDPATDLTANGLLAPLAKALDGGQGREVRTVLRDEATKDRLTALLSGGTETPDLLFTAGHGVVVPNGRPHQKERQGALLCQGWPGPQAWLEPLSPEHYFTADDLPAEARLDGLLTFHFACFSGGSPKFEDFSAPSVRTRVPVGPESFVARLPQRLLDAGALAVIGHIEHTWESAVEWPGAGRHIQVFQDTLERLLGGDPVGAAMECFAVRYADLATELCEELQAIWRGEPSDDARLSGLWTGSNDARNFAVLGDPAVRLAPVETGNSAISETRR